MPPPSVTLERAPLCKARDLQAVQFCVAQRLVGHRDVPGEWWRLFRSRPLNDLMERALNENHDLKAAQAALRAAHANYEAQRGALFPVVDLNYLPSRQKVASRDFSAPTWSLLPYYTLHTAQLTISYVPDVFGGIQRQIEVSAAQEDLQQFVLEATYLTLTSNLALAAIQEASLRQQIVVTWNAIGDEKLLRDSRLNKSKADEAALDAGIGQGEQTLPLLAKQLTMQRDMLAALSGQFAGFGLPEQFWMKDMQLPRDLPVSLSSQIVEQRPDACGGSQSTRRHGGGGRCDRQPAPTVQSFRQRGLDEQSIQVSVQLQSAVHLLDACRQYHPDDLRRLHVGATKRAAEAGWDQAAEQYQTAVVNAFQNVADALQAIDRDQESVRWAVEAKDAAARNRCLTAAVFVGYDGEHSPKLNVEEAKKPTLIGWWNKNCRRYPRLQPPYFQDGETKTGADVLVAEQLYLSSQIALVQAEATRLSDVVALFQALGGGWWNRLDTIPSDAPILVAAPPN
jgi:outer membrane protein TolC